MVQSDLVTSSPAFLAEPKRILGGSHMIICCSPSTFLLGSVSVIAITGLPQMAQAQTAPTVQSSPDAGDVGEIVVTANKQTQSVQKISSVVTVISGNTLADRQVTDVRGLQNLTPSLKFSSNATASPTFLRGVGQTSNATGNDPAVSVNVDGVNMYQYALGGTLYDLQRVEVVYGPQGTLYGRNSTAGAINFITNRPKDDFGGYLTVGVGNYGLLQTTAAADLPISSTLKARVAVNAIRHRGYTSSGQPGDAGEGGQSDIAGRLSLLWTPTSRLSILAKAEIWHGGGSSQIAVNYPFVNPSNPWYTPLTRAQWATWNDSRMFLASAEIKYDLGNGISLTYVPGYLQNSSNYTLANGGADALKTSGIPSTYVRRYYLPWIQESNELRLSQVKDRYQWLVGLYQYYGNSNSDPGLAYIAFPGITNVPPARISYSGYDHTEERAWAAFAQGTYSILDDLRLTVGGRFSYDPKYEDFNSGTIFTAGQFEPSGMDTTVPGGVHVKAHYLSRHFDYKVGAEWDVKPDVMVYANVATGFLDGGLITQPPVGISPSFKPEYLTQYAAGIKSEFFNRKLVLNNEFFYYDYRGLQLTTAVIDPLTGLKVSGVVNANRVKIYGDDLSIDYHFDRNTALSLKVGFLPTAKITDLVTISGDYSGYRMPYAAKITAAAGLSHTWHLRGGGMVRARIDSLLSSGYWEIFSHLANTYEHSYTRTSLGISYTPRNGKWTLRGWADNLENDWQISQAKSGTAVVAAPRTFGMSVTTYF